jgi:hypothetical protein
MAIPALIAAGGAILGGALAGRSAERAARTSADAQLRAAELAAEEARFRPVGITTRFGQSQFGFDPEGRLTSAGYSVDPEIRALQERLLGVAPGALERGLLARERITPVEQAAQGLFGLGGGYLAESPEAARERFMAQQTALLDPIRQREERRLGASVFGRGRAGLNIGDMGQPELFALAAARRQQDLELARQAEAAAQQQIGFGAGLFGTGAQMLSTVPAYETAALGPFQTQLGLAQTIEQLGQQPLDIGAQLGGRSATAGAQAGEALLRGGLGAAQTQLAGQQAALGMQYGAARDVLGLLTRPGLFGGGRSGGGSLTYDEIAAIQNLGGTVGPQGYTYYGM